MILHKIKVGETISLGIKSRGVTLIEMIVVTVIVAILFSSAYGLYAVIIKAIAFYRTETTVSALAGQYLEIARNLPYAEIGTVNGNPPGNLPDETNTVTVIFNGYDYRVYYVVNALHDPADSNPTVQDYKQVKLYVEDVDNGKKHSFVTTVAPINLASMGSGGALSIEVFDSVGQPVSSAQISIVNNDIVPNINLSRTSDINGNWDEVGLPESANNYHVTVSKSGYSVDQTYPSTIANPDPTKPDATILNGQVTQISFSIDKTSSLVFDTLDQSCQPLSGIDLEIQGSKLIGTPNVFKFDNNYTSGAGGQIQLSNIEWDNYTPLVIGGQGYMIYGSYPVQQVILLPDTSQNFNLILGPKTDHSLLVVARDSSTDNPIEGAYVNLQGGSPLIDVTQVTGGSILSQQGWSGGSGQENFTDEIRYFEDDGNISASVLPAALRLAEISGSYVSSGYLISSTFDTGTSSTQYTTLAWNPASQDPAASVRFQIASNNDNSTWDFAGPDGTAGTFYTVPGSAINSLNNNNRYIRYKVFLSTTNFSITPVLSNLSINYVSGCFTPGQTVFPGLSQNTYQAIISAPGYLPQTVNNIDVSGYYILQVSLSQ